MEFNLRHSASVATYAVRHAESTAGDVTDALYGGAFLPASMVSKGNFSWITNPAPTRFRDFDYQTTISERILADAAK
jgi:hypothetical protein